ncbi:ABC transporter ATP-binding protein [Kitasatospora sp. NPDC018058]|uniref:ABC transporter ATP-binding protein n=1 Tax=Kitasatospora sp. NPDC018058 TaxID=3364025 RepID=UPI0037C0B569
MTDFEQQSRLRIRVELLRGNRLQLVAAMALALGSAAASLAVPILVQRAVADFGAHRSWIWPITWMVGLAMAGALASAAAGYLLGRMGEALILRLRDQATRHTLRLPLSVVRAEGHGNLVARITSDAVVLRSIVDVGVVQLPLAALTTIATLAVMAWLDWVLTLVTIASFAAAGAAIAAVVLRVRRNVIEQQSALGELAQYLTVLLSSLMTIKAYQAEETAAERHLDRAKDLMATSLTGVRLQSLISPVLGLGQQVALVSVIIGGGARIADGALSVPAFAAFLLFLLQLVSPVTMLATGISRLQAGLAAKSRFETLLAMETETDGPAPARTAPTPAAAAPSVEFVGVSFAHDGVPVLENLSFTAARRGLTALVGPSGAGKSTTLSLIERFLQPDAGAIRVLGHDASTWPVSALRSRIAFVDQAFTLLEGTVRENLLIGHSDLVPDDRIFAALESVGLEEDIRRLPSGLDTVIGRVNDLSGGQRQRLALARALLSDAELVILDEPTSQLDSINEKRLREIVEDLARSRAVIVVAHRLSTIRNSGQVILIDRGRSVDSGTHDELMERCPAYRDLVESQQVREHYPA